MRWIGGVVRSEDETVAEPLEHLMEEETEDKRSKAEGSAERIGEIDR